jgi:DNA-binding transcriptional LysR family regulator
MSRAFDSVQLGSIELFCKAAELQGFTAAANALGVTAAAVSRSISRLEDRIGVRLFTRTTRLIRLTDEGRSYFEQCRQALTQIEEAERIVGGNQAAPSGLLRISVPTTYAHFRLLPLLPKFMAQHPKIRVELNVSNRNIDFVEDGYDLAIRLGHLDDSRLVARKLEDASLGLFASSQYLKQYGTPTSLAQLRKRDCIQFVLPSTGRCMPWIFSENGQDVEFEFDARVRLQEDVLGGLTYAIAGGGLFQIYHFIAAQHVARGELVEVMQAFGGRSRPFSILYPQNRHLSAKVRAFVGFLSDAIKPKMLKSS